MASYKRINSRSTGEYYETIAAGYLEEIGHVIVEKNFRCRLGEIDLITRDGDYLVFVEVKYRLTNASGSPAEAVNYPKIRTICKVSDFYRFTKGLGDISVRYDVIAIAGEEITYIKNAFDYIG